MSGRARKSSSPPGTAPRAPKPDEAPPATPPAVELDAHAVAVQARTATGGGRANVAGILRADGVLRVVGSSVGPLAGPWRRATELARDGERPLVAEVDSNGNVRIHTDPTGATAPVDVALGEGRSA